jgi:excisionase family DNA binding protein
MSTELDAPRPKRAAYTLEEVAEIFRVSPSTVYKKMVRQQGLRTVRAGNQLRVPAEAVDDFLAGRRSA